MKATLLAAALTTGIIHGAFAQDAEPVEDTLAWLRLLALDARLDYRISPSAEPDLFHQTVPDGRSLMQYIADELGEGAGAERWPKLDQAVGVCLAEADRLAILAEEAGDGSPEETALNTARKRFLTGAAALLAGYGAAANGVFDAHGSTFDGVPDWVLPGEIQIKEAAGSARINMQTKEFGGRLSGEVALPKFDANFVVPNASFDSRGNIDLSAYGMASFPPDLPDKVTIAVPKRRPLILHLSEDGDFRIAGSGRVKLPDGNQFEAHFDADHPMYEFGLAYAGNLTLEMAKEVTLLRPTIDPATIFEPDAILGLGQFFGSLGKGYETFMEDSPELPSLDDLNIGVAPEFATPETVVSFDVFDAWAVGLVNDEVRPLVNGSFDTSVQFARKQIRTMRDSVRAAQSEIAPSLEQIRKLRRQLEELAKARKALEDAEAAVVLGGEATVALTDVLAATEQAADIAAEYLDNTPADADFKTGFAAVKLWLEAEATAQGTGSDAAVNAGAAFPKIDQWTNTAFGRFGYDKDGDVVDQAKADALSPSDLRVLALTSLELETNRQGLGEDVGSLVYRTFFQREFEVTNALYEKAITDGDIEARAQYAARIHQLWVIAAQTRFTTDQEDLGIMFSARDDTIAAIAAAGGDTPEQLALARKVFIAGLHLNEAQDDVSDRRVDEILGERVGTRRREKKDLAQRAELGPGNHGFFSQWYFALKAFSDEGVISMAQRTEYEISLAGLMRFYTDAQVEAFSDVTKIEQNLEGAFNTLLIMLDLLAMADDALPDDTELLGTLEANWQALHVPWIGVAEAKRAHFYLSAYAVEIGNATERYGDGMATALKNAAKTAGSEAIRGLSTVVDYLAGVVDGIGLEEFDFALPGDMQVQRAFGVLKFDVSEEPPSWDFEFGGQLYFSDYDLTFAVPSAHIFSDGMFDVSLMTEGPVPFGFEETMRLSTAFAMSGNVLTPSISSLIAGGTLTYTPEDGGTPEEFMGTLSYNFDDGHFFGFETSFDGARQLFTEEVALFSGGFGFALQLDETGAPQQGEVQANIDLGLLLREDADLAMLDPDDYWLNFAGSAEVNFSVVDRSADFRLLSGTLTLPPDIFSNEDATAPATIAIESVVCVRVDFENQTISWCDEAGGPTVLLTANNIHAAIPGLEGSDLAINTGKLRLSGTDFPVIEQLDASLTLPLPGGDEATVNIDVANWPIDGLPESVAITLEEPGLTLIDLDGIKIQVKAQQGVDYGGCPAGISFAHDAVAEKTTFRIASAFAIDMDPDMLWDAGENASVGTEVSGCFTWEVGQLPTFVLSDFTISGHFYIGGENGIELLGARGNSAAMITFSNLENIFHRPPAAGDPFAVTLDGAVNFSDIIQFELIDSAFIWDGSVAASDLLPRFDPGEVCFVAGEDGIDLVEDLLPIYPTELCLRFADGSLPIFPGAGEMGLFDPLNITVITSGVVTLPNGGAVDGGSPGISGAVTNVEIVFIEDSATGFPVPDFIRTMSSIESLTLQLENLDIPPLGGITGGLHLGNLDAIALGNYDELFFAGNLGAKVNNIGASVLLAAKPTEFVGACFSLSGGPAGIPLGPSGFMITGASGGINFKNNFSDPCDFESYITIGENNVPTEVNMPDKMDRGTSPPDVDELGEQIETDLANNPVNTNPELGDQVSCILPMTPDFNCIQGPFPPPTINPLCEKITIGGEDRIIFKGTNLLDVDAVLLAAGISQTALDAMTPGDVIDLFVGAVVGQVEIAKDQIMMGDFDLNPANGLEFDPNTVDPRALAFFDDKMTDLLNSVDDAARNALREGFNKALKLDPDASLYAIIVAKAAEGIPCFDVTLRVEGTLSHAAVSTVLSGTGAVTLSSTGTAVVDGQINLVGIPVGDATLALSLTNENGNIDPTFGGVAEVALGPLEIGRMTMSLGCPGCFDVVSDAVGEWVAINAGAFAPDVEDFIIQMMDCAVPIRDADGVLIPRDLATPVDVHFMDTDDDDIPYFGPEQRVALMSCLMNIFQVVVDNAQKVLIGQQPDPLPVVVSQGTLDTFLGSFTQLITRVLVDANPRICFGGDVGPKIFGFPLTGGSDGALGGGLLYQRNTDLATGVDYQELVAQMQFSPAQTLSSVLMGSFAYTLPTAIDAAQMGYSLRMPAFTDDNVALMLTAPAQFASNQLETLVEDSVFSFGYQLQPLGYKLADGQGRVIMPRLGGHPSRSMRTMRDPDDPSNTLPLLAWVNPDSLNDPEIPTRMELILAALSKGQLQNPLWRGSRQDLASLFSAPGTGCYQPSNGGCDLLTGQVAARVNLDKITGAPGSALPDFPHGLDLANNYFPHGGFIGGAELALPNMVARPAPTDRLALLFTVPNAGNFTEWSDNAGVLFGDPGATFPEEPRAADPAWAYFTGTTCSGQLAMYLPFPDPPAGFNIDTASLEEFVDSISSLDMSKLADRSLPSFRDDLILLSGWLDAPVMGMPVAQGSIDYNPAQRCFLLEAQIPETWDHDDDPLTAEVDSWLANFVTGEVEIEIRQPDYLASAAEPPADGMIERLAQIGTNLNPANAAAIISEIQATMPKASMNATAGVQIPAELQPFIRASANPELSVFAFSPEFEPLFEPTNFTPYAIAKRRGGFGLSGTFDVGYWPEGGDPIVVNGFSGSLAITPDSGAGVFPAVAGALMASEVNVPGLPELTNAAFTFNSSPDDMQPFTLIEGEVEPLVFKVPNIAADLDLLRIRAVDGGNLSGSFAVRRDDTAGVPTVATSIAPAVVDMPFLGQGVAVSIYGDTPTDNFEFSSTPGVSWTATVCLTGTGGPGTAPTLLLRDPTDPLAGPSLLEFTPNDEICGTITGDGVQGFSMRLDIPRGMLVTAFKNQPTEASVTLGSGLGFYTMYIDHFGRSFIDFGQDLGVDLPGAFSAGGHIVFGINTTGSSPMVNTGAVAINFPATEVFETRTRSVNISNAFGLATASVFSSIAGADARDFTVLDPSFALDPGEGHDIDLAVLFHPETAGAKDAELHIQTNDPNNSLITVDLNAVATATPKYFQSRDSIAFGNTVVGGTSTGTFTIGNSGHANLLFTSSNLSGVGYSIEPPLSNTVLPPGASRTHIVSFSPLDKVPYSGTITINTVGQQAPHTIILSGMGAESQWVTVRDPAIAGTSTALNDIEMLSTANGWVVGDGGVVLQTQNGGHSWIPREFAAFDLQDIAVENSVVNNTLLASYHFEGPIDASQYLDASGNNHHGISTNRPKAVDTSSALPLVSGSWLSFLGSGTDHVDFPGLVVTQPFSISFWVNPSTTVGNNVFVGKNTSAGNNEFVFGIINGNYRFFTGIGNANLASTVTTGWQHWTLYSDYSGSTGESRIWSFKDGAFQTQLSFPGQLQLTPGGKAWTLGNEWDSNGRSDFLTGGMDEVYFHSGYVSTTEQALLRRGGQRLAIAGHNGQAFNSYNGGSKWTQLPGQDVAGWRGSGNYYDYDWNGAGFSNSGELYLAGRRDDSSRVLLLEQPPVVSGQPSEFDDAPFSSGQLSNEYFTGAFSTASNLYVTASSGYVYKANTFTSNWGRHGSALISGGALAGTDSKVTVDPDDYSVVGVGGNVLNSDAGNIPEFVNPPDISTTLRGIDHDSGKFHAVGDGGLYATSSNKGADWDKIADGLSGNNRAIASESTRTWVVGEQQTIQYRPGNGDDPSAAFLVFDPGELDFGFLLRGRAKTLPLRLYNRGRSALAVNSLTVSGNGFSLVQGGVSELAPQDWVTVYVRYKPLVDSDQDLGTLTIATDAGDFDVPLRGRADNQRWFPYVFATGGNSISGEVKDVVFTNLLRGYALVKTSGTSSDRVYRTTNGGSSWTVLTLPSLGAGESYDLDGLDFVGTGSSGDDGYACGAVIFRGGMNRGIVIRSLNGGTTWTVASPTDVSRRFSDIKALSKDDPNRVVVASTGSGDGDVWDSEDYGGKWGNHQNPPASGFDGSLVGLGPNALAGEDWAIIFTTEGSTLYSKIWTHNWSVNASFQTSAAQPIRDFQFIDSPDHNYGVDFGWMVGDKGLFWRIAPAAAPPSWTPADNAEVFGTTDLAGVAFIRNGNDDYRGWAVGGSSIFRSNTGGHTWDTSFVGGVDVEMSCVAAPSVGGGVVGGSVGGKAVMWRYAGSSTPAAPILSADDVVLVGDTTPGGEITVSVPLQNIGTEALDIHEVALDSADPLSRFELVGAAPTSIAQGATQNLTVRFKATPEPEFAAIFEPDAFYRFEQGRGATIFYNDNGEGADATASATAARQPKIVEEGLARDRCLSFDGGDYAEFDGPSALDGDFSIACWVNVEDTSNHKAFFGKHSNGGGTNFVLGGIYNGKYTFRILGVDEQEVAATTGWQHIAVTCQRSGSETIVRFYKDGVEIWNSPDEGKTFPIAGNVTGRPWVLGADWDGGGSLGDFFDGCMDDFMLVQRLLSPEDIAKLMTKSPVAGLHRAKLVVRSDGDFAAREIDLRAEVEEVSEMIVFDSDVPGQTVLIDGEDYTMPVAFAVGSASTSAHEWAAGSMHTVEYPDGVDVTNADGDMVSYALQNVGDKGASNTQTFCAALGMGDQTADYVMEGIDDGDDPPPAAVPNANHQSLIEALVGTPQGPFFRLSDGEVAVPAVGDLDLNGSLFVSLTGMNAQLNSSAFTFPQGFADPWMDIGASGWELDFVAGSHFKLSAQPPTVDLLGKSLGPDVGMEFVYNLTNGAMWDLNFDLDQDFKPFPGYLEFRQGEAGVGFDGSNYHLAFDGGVRALRLPDLSTGQEWVIDQNTTLSISGPDIEITKSDLGLGSFIANAGPLRLDFAAGGDMRFAYNLAEGATLSFDNIRLRAFNSTVISSMDGSVNSSGVASFGANVSQIPFGGGFTLRPQSGATAPVEFEIAAGLVPQMRLKVPAMSLRSTITGFPATGLDVPGLDIDTSGELDTGKIPLPAFSFEGIALAAPANAEIDDHHIRLRRTSGAMKFDIRAEVPFPLISPPKFSLSTNNFTVDASVTSDFGVLDSPLSLEYSSGSTCQFSGSDEDGNYTIYFGSACGGVKSNGICIIGVCPP